MKTKFVPRVIIGCLLAIIINFTVENLSPQMRAQAGVNGYRIMPLGGSSTAGSPLGGGYRIKLWNTALANNWNIDFVGSQSNGPQSLGDKDHEGHPGARIDQIAGLVDDKLATYKPHIILLYTGTNDAVQNYDIINAPHRLQSLTEQIFHALPSVQLLVGKLGPATNDKINANIQKINAAIPSIVSFEQAQGHNIKLVDMSRVLTKNDLVDGIHPKPEGYDKMADEWATAIQPLLNTPNPASDESSNFQNTCKNIFLSGNVLTATCNSPTGQSRPTSIQLKGIENIDGELRVTNSKNQSNFQSSCNNISLHGNEVSASCASLSGKMQKTSIVLDGIENLNGILEYTSSP